MIKMTMDDRPVISQSTIDEVARVGREYPDGIHTCAELQRLEPGRRPCTCGRCPDPTEYERRRMIASGEPERDAVEAIMQREKTWTTDQMVADFEVIAFSAPLVVVKRRSDGKKGTLEFTHRPRIYFGWEES